MIIYEKERSNGNEYIYHQDNVNLQSQKHTHDSFEIIFVLEGSIECEIENDTYIVEKNYALLIMPRQIHSYKTTHYSKSYLCIFSSDFVYSFYEKIKGKKLSNPVLYSESKMIDMLKCDSNIFMKKSLFYYLCSVVYGQSELETVNEANSNLATLIAFYVQDNYTKNISLSQIARKYGYNYTYLSSFFNTNFKQNFSSYVNQFRIQYAAYLLETTDKGITEIVSECGFSTIRNFNFAFKNQYHISPKEYRSNHCGYLGRDSNM